MRLFQIYNANVRLPGKHRKRIWMEPGCPTVVLPGIPVSVFTERDSIERYKIRFVCGSSLAAFSKHALPGVTTLHSITRATEIVDGRPVRVLAEFTYDHVANEKPATNT